jgi:hypothetical protein
VEVENLYDEALVFEPIHRVLFNIELDVVQKALSGLPEVSFSPVPDVVTLQKLVAHEGEYNRYGLIAGDTYILVETSGGKMATMDMEPLLDQLKKDFSALSIDYIHGAKELCRLAQEGQNNAVGILLPPVQKKGLFETVARYGNLPRKSFSMGEAEEKRFYLECRELF